MAETTHKSIFGIAAAIVVVVLGYFVYDRTRNPCESIFEDTATNIKADVAFIKTRGAVIIGKEKLRELDEKSNQLGLTLKACCIAAPTEFLKCKEEGSQQEARLAQIKTFVEEAQTAQTQGRTEVVQQKSAEANRAVEEVNSKTEGFVQRVAQLQPASPPPRDQKMTLSKGAETEPNNESAQVNKIALNSSVAAEIAQEGDADWFSFRANTKVRDWLEVILEPLSDRLGLRLDVRDQNKNRIEQWSSSAPGANITGAFAVIPDQDYLISVTAWSSDPGPYKLTTKLRKAYDAFEPNETPNTPKPISADKAIEASILDSTDQDWYELKNFGAAQMIVRFENLSSTLGAGVEIRGQNQNEIGRASGNNRGAHVDLKVVAETGKNYYVGIVPWTKEGGSYRLLVSGAER